LARDEKCYWRRSDCSGSGPASDTGEVDGAPGKLDPHAPPAVALAGLFSPRLPSTWVETASGRTDARAWDRRHGNHPPRWSGNPMVGLLSIGACPCTSTYFPGPPTQKRLRALSPKPPWFGLGPILGLAPTTRHLLACTNEPAMCGNAGLALWVRALGKNGPKKPDRTE